MIRRILGAALVAAVPGLFSPIAVHAQQTLNVVSYGGATIATWREMYFKPFTAQTGTPIKDEEWNGNLTQIETMVKAGRVNWDVVDFGGEIVDTACDQGLIEPFDVSKIGGKDRFFPGMVHKCGIASKTNASGFGYDASKFPNGEPTKISDLLDLKKFPGKRALNSKPNFTFEQALMADGVPGDKVYEILKTEAGVQRVFRILDRIKDQVIWFDSAVQAVQLLLDNEVIMTNAGSHHFIAAAEKTGRPLKFLWDGSARITLYWGIVKGSPNKDLAYKFLDFANKDEIQGRWAAAKNVTGPPLKAVLTAMPDATARALPTHPDNMKNIYVSSSQFWGDYGQDYQLRFNAWLGKK